MIAINAAGESCLMRAVKSSELLRL
jgi:hypothetical protein